jgi:hypothetical protein
MTFNFSERYVLALNVLLAALVIPYFAARSVSEMIKMHYAASVVPAAIDGTAPRAEASLGGARPRGVYNTIVERDVFNLAPARVEATPVETEDLKITLLGTSHLTGGDRAFAIFEDQAGSQQLYRLGEAIPGVGKLVHVGKNRVIIDRNGHPVAVEIPKDSLGQPADEGDEGARPGPRRHGLRPPFIRNRSLNRRHQCAEYVAVVYSDSRRAGPPERDFRWLSPERDPAGIDFSADGPAGWRCAHPGFGSAYWKPRARDADAFDAAIPIQHHAERAA